MELELLSIKRQEQDVSVGTKVQLAVTLEGYERADVPCEPDNLIRLRFRISPADITTYTKFQRAVLSATGYIYRNYEIEDRRRGRQEMWMDTIQDALDRPRTKSQSREADERAEREQAEANEQETKLEAFRVAVANGDVPGYDPELARREWY